MGVFSSIGWRCGVTDARQWLRPAVRLLLLLTSVLILVMPLTESLCNWDRFLRGGSDVEFTLLAGLLFAALVVLAMERSMTQPLAAIVLRGWVAVDALRTMALRWASSLHADVVCSLVLEAEARPFAPSTRAMMPLRI